MCASRYSGISMHVTILPYHMIPYHTIPYHMIWYHLLSLMRASAISIHLTIPNVPSYHIKPSYPSNACFPPDSGIGMHISALPLIRVTSGYPGDIREGGMHYLPPVVYTVYCILTPSRTINLSQLTVNHCRHGEAWWYLSSSSWLRWQLLLQNLSKYLLRQNHLAFNICIHTGYSI